MTANCGASLKNFAFISQINSSSLLGFVSHFDLSCGLPLQTRSQTPVPGSPLPFLTFLDCLINQHLNILFVALAIKCKNCVSSESMEDCKDREESVDCDSVQLGFVADRCVKMSVEYGGFKSFVKTCYSKQLCEQGNEAFKNCKHTADATCKLNCCDSNYCNNGLNHNSCDSNYCNNTLNRNSSNSNSGTAPLVSALLMIVCTLTSVYLC